MKIIYLAAGPLIALALTACSSTPVTGTNADGSAATASTASGAAKPATVAAAKPKAQARDTAAIAKAIGCTGYGKGDGNPPGVKVDYGQAVTDVGHCTFHGFKTQLFVVVDPRDVASLQAMFKFYGGDPSAVAHKGVWAATPSSYSVVGALQAALNRT